MVHMPRIQLNAITQEVDRKRKPRSNAELPSEADIRPSDCLDNGDRGQL